MKAFLRYKDIFLQNSCPLKGILEIKFLEKWFFRNDGTLLMYSDLFCSNCLDYTKSFIWRKKMKSEIFSIGSGLRLLNESQKV